VGITAQTEDEMTRRVKLFLSCVSSEFAAHRALLAGDLKRPDLDVAVQEDFVVSGGSTLEKLDDYIHSCDAVVHLIGKAPGAVPEEQAVAALRRRYDDLAARLPPLGAGLAKPQPDFSYTQWEAYLALYHERPLYVYYPSGFAPDGPDVPRSQSEHYHRISALGHDRGQFLNEERLSSAVLRDLVEILPRLEQALDVPPTRLPQTAERLFGRDEDLSRLDAAWNNPAKNVVVVRAFGGMGKTSLVASWMAELALKRWRGAERVFEWSFYSQGTSDQRAASADTFIAAALRAFGDPDPTLGSPWDRGARLARLVGGVRCLLVLDGLEPLQYPPGPMQAKLKDPGVEALLKGLAGLNAGLCVVTTREELPDIQQYYGRTADDIDLAALTDLAGAALLHHHGARHAGARGIAHDDPELRTASREVSGHGLTLQLVGQYLALAEGGDILRRDTVRLADADREYKNDATRPYGHAFKAMEAYERWFEREGEDGRRQLAVMRLLGLFDRSASRSCLDALREEPVIAGLTEPLVGLSPRQWEIVSSRLQEINLLTAQADRSLDAHPLLREYFARRVREQQPEAWRTAQRRLFEHLCATTEEGERPTLADLEPLYQAVAHGCEAGLQQQACNDVYERRILRGETFYSSQQLGAMGSNLGAVASFFEPPWSCVSPLLTEATQSWLLAEAAFYLGALGRLTEALEPMREALDRAIEREAWTSAAVGASNLSELELTLGELVAAAAEAARAVDYADRSGDAFHRLSKRATHADALHQAGRRNEAEARFKEAERMQAELQPGYPLLYSLRGFNYCELLLAEAERAAWQRMLGKPGRPPLRTSCQAVSERTTKTLGWANEVGAPLLDIALNHLTLGRAAFYAAILDSSGSDLRSSGAESDTAISGIRNAGQLNYLPRGLLTRAWQRSHTGGPTGPEGAQADLDEAWEIAERGPMPLFQAEVHLHRARLFHDVTPYPWATSTDGNPRGPRDDLADARRMIEKHGYWRRKEELEDAEAAARDWRPLAS
jgi:tetratricopeptide (TPR) repeat protein